MMNYEEYQKFKHLTPDEYFQYISAGADVLGEIDKDRRNLPNSKNKEMLRAGRQTPCRLADGSWLVYNLPRQHTITYEFQQKRYALIGPDEQLSFVGLSELVAHLEQRDWNTNGDT